MQLPFLDILKNIGETADALGVEVYVVGGFVRDVMLGRPTKDLDFVSIGAQSGIRLAQSVAERYGVGLAHIHKNFGTAGLHVWSRGKGLELEFVGARRESYNHDSRKPMVEDGTLEEDQLRRDFTINAMAICPTNSIE